MIDQTYFQGKKVAFHTLGCKLNFAETSAIGKKLLEEGFTKVKPNEQADVCIINTCSVTDTADKKCRQAIHKFTKKHPNAYVVVTGCYAQLKPEEIANIPGVSLVLGTKEKFAMSEFLTRFADTKEGSKIAVTPIKENREFSPSTSADDRTRYFLKIQDGCDYYCTYCTIPFARGRSRNGSIADTVKAAEEAVALGAKEIVLSGVNIGDFGKSTGESFYALVKALDEVEGVERFRISSIEPNLLTDEIIEFVSTSKRFAPHFHIPLQSGSDSVLKLMKRRYDTALFAQRISHIKQVMPHAFIGVDVIVGVRGETLEYFEEGCHFLESLPISQLHVFTYSERAGTKALEIDYVVAPAERKRRSDVLHELSAKKHAAFHASQLGRPAHVLWESTKRGTMMHGFTENYLRQEAEYDKTLINTVQPVVIQ